MSTRKSSICIEKKEKEKIHLRNRFKIIFTLIGLLLTQKYLSLLFSPKAPKHIHCSNIVAVVLALPEQKKMWIFSSFLSFFSDRNFSRWPEFPFFHSTQNPSSCQLSHSYNNINAMHFSPSPSPRSSLYCATRHPMSLKKFNDERTVDGIVTWHRKERKISL